MFIYSQETLNNVNYREIERYMRLNINDHIDKDTGEVNCTTMTADAMDHFSAWEFEDEFDEIAFYVADQWQMERL